MIVRKGNSRSGGRALKSTGTAAINYVYGEEILRQYNRGSQSCIDESGSIFMSIFLGFQLGLICHLLRLYQNMQTRDVHQACTGCCCSDPRSGRDQDMPIPTEFCKRKRAPPHGHLFRKMTRRYDDELACELGTNAKQPTRNRQGPRALKALWTTCTW